MTASKETSPIKKFINPIVIVIGVMGTLLGIVGGLIGLHLYIVSQVDARIRQPEYMRAVAREVRPFILFNLDSAITYDGGASDLIEDLSVIVHKPDNGGGPDWTDKDIIITFNEPNKIAMYVMGTPKFDDNGAVTYT